MAAKTRRHAAAPCLLRDIFLAHISIGHRSSAGIRTDGDRQVLWVMPRDPDWDAVFRFAIQKETGYGPFVVQCWLEQQGTLVRSRLRIIDTEMLVRGS